MPTEKLNPHERAPAAVRELYNECRRLSLSQIDSHPHILDVQGLENRHLPDGITLEHCIPQAVLKSAFDQFMGSSFWRKYSQVVLKEAFVYGIQQVPGLQILPSLLPPPVQIEILSRLLHRDLCNKRHQTNLHLHYNISYPVSSCDASERPQSVEGLHRDTVETGNSSFFRDEPTRLLSPKDPTVHRPLSIQAALSSKLRWMTLGGQYNWTSKEYPPGAPPPFPPDIGALLHSIFPKTTAEAAIVNLYSPGDTLFPHRDVSEECDTGLISVSFGCDGLFMVGHGDEDGCAVIRLRSGDAVYMTGSSRFAWHAVPKIIPSTCPTWLEGWPGDNGRGDDTTNNQYREWKGWMARKRVNLNVRQMFPQSPPLEANFTMSREDD
ncbi:hypothetical protein PRK78_003569 [Emydomyces testavorans]|uniref:mRNA N(6)-methyladenine demethylase n=1 Tax=Emydomyces testavorans TaxID=2070801 RepID=A0AAF0DIC1_9EURO|nr:hypothetical protein PRK78_003569 [Emydomyces testavorans]